MNAERLLGALLKQGLRSGRRRRRRRRSSLGRLLPGGVRGAAGLGLLGVAIAAFEHFTQKNQTSGVQPPPPGGGAVPPPPPEGARPSGGPPPPPPGPPPTRSTGPSGEEQAGRDVLILIRAMAAAANADGRIDESERKAVLDKLDEAGLGAQEREFVERELRHPPDLDTLVRQVNSPELARQVYVASRLAIEVDTPAEEEYLRRLRDRLGLDDATAEDLEREFGGD